MASRTAAFDRFPTPSWSVTGATLKVWSIIRLVHEVYGEALELARKAERRGLIVE